MSVERTAPSALTGVEFDGGYRIDGLIGQGGMGAVYKATHLRLEKTVAIKVLARSLSDSAEYLGRFRREAMITGGLGHPHIVQVFDLSTTPTGEPFLAMEYLEGEDLDHRLSRVGRLTRDDTLHVVKQIAGALSATHAKGIVHRDLKPANVYLMEVAGESNFVKVLDFGISKMRAAADKLTRTLSVMGTPNYMSPEQAQGKTAEVDERTDQWALACIAWECLSGQRPFDGEESTSILYQVVHEPPAPMPAGVRPEIQAVLLRALSKSKHDRFASVSELALALEHSMVVDRARPETVVEPRPRTLKLPDAGKSRTTFSQSTGELTELAAKATSGRKRWGLAVGIALVLLVAGIFVLRPRRLAPISPRAAQPTMTTPEPPPAPVPALPAPVPAVATEPAVKPSPPTAAPDPPPSTPASKPSSVKKTKKPAQSKTEGARDKPAAKTKKENQDQWIVE